MTLLQDKWEQPGTGGSHDLADEGLIMKPKFKVSLTQEDIFPREFTPLTPPMKMACSYQDLEPELIDKLRADVMVNLRPGTYRIPLAGADPFMVQIQENSQLNFRLSAGLSPVEKEQKLLVRNLELSFDPPLLLTNILPTLINIQTLFEDRQVSGLRQRLSGSAPGRVLSLGWRQVLKAWESQIFPGLSAFLDPAGTMEQGLGRMTADLKEGSERLALVRLSRAVAKPVKQGKDWLLAFRFSGEVDYLGRVPMPFKDLHLPRVILPAPHAVLSHLLSDNPLATAYFHQEHLDLDKLLKEMTDLVAGFEGALMLEGRLPALTLRMHQPDQGVFDLDATLPGPVSFNSLFSGQFEQNEIKLDFKKLTIGKSDCELNLEGKAQIGLESQPDKPEQSVAGLCLSALQDRKWPEDKLGVALELKVQEGSSLPSFEVLSKYHHPMIKGGIALPVLLNGLAMQGKAAWSSAVSGAGAPEAGMELDFSCGFVVPESSRLDDGRTCLSPRLTQGKLEGEIHWDGGKDLEWRATGSGKVQLEGETQVEDFPELEIEEGKLMSSLTGRVAFDTRIRTRQGAEGLLEADARGSSLELVVDQARLKLGSRKLVVPEASRFEVKVSEGNLNSAGLGTASIDLMWDFQGASPVLSSPEHQAEIFVAELRQGAVNLKVSQEGGLTISGQQGGLYDARFFNALLNPGAEIQRWMDVLGSDEAVNHVIDAVRVFIPDLAEMMIDLRQFIHKCRDILEDEGVKKPGDIIPGRKIARVLSRVLDDSLKLTDRIYPIVKQVTDGDGLNVPELKRLLSDTLPEHEFDFEIDRIIRWIALVLSPTDPVRPFRVREVLPLVENPLYTAEFKGLPSAGEMYKVVNGRAPLSPAFSAKVVRVAPYLNMEQLDYFLSRDRNDWPEADRARLTYILELKKRVRIISEHFGGLGYLAQAMAIAFFLGEALRVGNIKGPEFDLDAELSDGAYPLADCLLGPEDVAVLLQAGLASVNQGRLVQLHQRMLLDLILSQPPAFLSQVLVEMGGGNERVLAGVIYALLGLEHDRLNESLDIASLFSERLGVQFPYIEDYMAGGRWARQSYFEVLSLTAKRIVDGSENYLALKQYLQVQRHPVGPGFMINARKKKLIKAAQEAIEKADSSGSRLNFTGAEPTKRQHARQAYIEAFSACAKLLESDPHAFHLPWFKAFWSRNYEALMVLSVFRNCRKNVDRVRKWLKVRTGKGYTKDTETLIDRVIDALYFFEEDRNKLKADPLVRLLIEPPPGHYDFSVVSAMGVITEGARGRELEAAYRRMNKRRGIHFIRANTANVRSLEYNAARIEEAIRKVRTPWGFIGYSQGCANCLRTESMLMGGTPEQQALLDGLRCRQLLYSSANGSAHGTCGDWKFLQAIIDGDRFLKHYQAIFSGRAINFFLRNLGLVLDSRFFIHVMGGMQSLSHQGVMTLSRDGQYKGVVPTTLMRGVVEPGTLPEALEMLSNVLSRQIENSRHDTQVQMDEAVGHPIWVRTPYSELLEKCDMGAMVQRTHHWSPLLKATEFITTKRDIERAIYDYPKDRHVFPWIEVNARFGIIKKMETN